MNIFVKIAFTAIVGTFLLSGTAQAQKVSNKVMIHARTVAINCLGQWRTVSCIKAMGSSNKDLVLGYAGALNANGNKAALDILKQGCAAATVAEKNNMPTRAFVSAYNECSNTIYDLTTRTGVMPDQSHYQLLVAGSLCMKGEAACDQFETQMKAFVK